MAQMTFTVQSDLPRLMQWTAQLSREMRPKVADAMTAAARAAERAIKAQAPSKINNPTTWTLNSVFLKPANARNLSIAVGFKDYAVKGTPAAKYLEPIATGTRRSHKGFERLLQGSGLIGPSQYAIPTGVYPLKLNAQGNLSAGKYVQVLSRLKALGQQGYTANRSQSVGSQKKRSQADYFVTRLGGHPGIFARVGPKPKGNPASANGKPMGRPITSNLKRGYHTVFYVTRQPSYALQFDTGKILAKTFESVYLSQLARIVAG